MRGQASNQGKLPLSCWVLPLCLISAFHLQPSPPLSPLQRAGAEPGGPQVFWFLPFPLLTLMVPKAAPSFGLGQGFKGCMPSPWHSSCPRPVRWGEPSPPLSCSCENILAKLHSCHLFRWKSYCIQPIWAWKWEWRISQAEGFIKQSGFNLLQENTVMITHCPTVSLSTV